MEWSKQSRFTELHYCIAIADFIISRFLKFADTIFTIVVLETLQLWAMHTMVAYVKQTEYQL